MPRNRQDPAGLALAGLQGMSPDNVHVVVGFDFSTSSHAALHRAIGVSMRAPWHVLHFVCVLERADFKDAEEAQQRVTSCVRDELIKSKSEGKVNFFVHAHIGKPAEEILRVAKDVGAELIIVGGNGHMGIARAVLGSVSEKIVRDAGCTVEVARDKTYEYVPLEEVVEVEPHGHYVPPHRYTYEDSRVTLRPRDWPLF